jgi:protein-glutamine gamma-glutamyltransferase
MTAVAIASDTSLPRVVVNLALAGLAAAVLLNAHHLAWWATLFALLTIAWRLRATWQTHQLPGKRQRVLLTLLLTVAVAANFRTLSGIAAGATLLAAMTSAKLLESRSLRDWHTIVFAALFLLLAACLDRQQLWRLPLYLAALWLLALGLRGLGSVGGAGGIDSLRDLARSSARALAFAAPLALALFLLFPRLPGGFWAIPSDEEAITGLGDELSPGSISRLSESDEVAMRVRFSGPLPQPAERYWRGPVMHDFDGYTWRRRPSLGSKQPQLRPGGRAYRYEVWLEPNRHRALLALELPTGALPGFSAFTDDYQLLSFRPIDQPRSYELTSYTGQYDPEPLGNYLRRVDTRLPEGRNRRAVELGRTLRAGVADDAAFVRRTLDFLRQGGYEYTLTPPLLDLDSVDDLLFNTRQGFCGHYASAYATLMRAGGVPARVVTGYLGGEWNSFGQYLVLRQSHAHAWVEVWLEGRGWQRVDPTAVVAPERLQRDIFDLLGSGARSPARALRAIPWIADLIQGAEALNAWWQDRVLGYNFRSQLAFLDRIGISDGDWRRLALLLGGLSALWIAWIAWSLRDQLRPLRRDAATRQWLRLERRLKRHGYARLLHEGPMSFAQRVAATDPALGAQASQAAQAFSRLRYGPNDPARLANLRELRQSVAAIR